MLKKGQRDTVLGFTIFETMIGILSLDWLQRRVPTRVWPHWATTKEMLR